MVKVISYLFLSLLLINCNTKIEKNTSKFLENFDVFYDKFHEDTVFQVSRVKFPIQGKKINGFNNEEWNSKNWEILHTKISAVNTNEFKTNTIRTDSTFIEKCFIPNSGFYTEYRYKLIDGKWHLIYALDQNI